MTDATPLEAFRNLASLAVKSKAADIVTAIGEGRIPLSPDRKEFLLGLLAHVTEDQGDLELYVRKMGDAIEKSDNRTPEEASFLLLQLHQISTSDGPARRQIMDHLKHALVPKAKESDSNALGYLGEIASLGGRRQARPTPPPGF